MTTVQSKVSVDVVLLDVQRKTQEGASRDVQDAQQQVKHQQAQAKALREDLDKYEGRIDDARDQIQNIEDEPEPFLLVAMLGMDNREQRIAAKDAQVKQTQADIGVVDAKLDANREDMGQTVERMQSAIEGFSATSGELQATLETTAALQEEIARS